MILDTFRLFVAQLTPLYVLHQYRVERCENFSKLGVNTVSTNRLHCSSSPDLESMIFILIICEGFFQTEGCLVFTRLGEEIPSRARWVLEVNERIICPSSQFVSFTVMVLGVTAVCEQSHSTLVFGLVHRSCVRWELQHWLSNREEGQSIFFRYSQPHRTSAEAEGFYEHQWCMHHDFKILGLNFVCTVVQILYEV